ncbi:MAG: hypothetical protein HC908_12170 [Calothrix sp. SM1_7_51]|nr:hypothetical protein [Calothrix sp. SM1_7_51]
MEHFDYNQTKVEIHFQEIIQQLKNEYTIQQNLRARRYAIANIIELFRYLKSDLTGYQLENLAIRQADFRNLKLLNINFCNSYFDDCLFSILLGSILWVVFSSSGSLLAAGDINGNINVWQVNRR